MNFDDIKYTDAGMAIPPTPAQGDPGPSTPPADAENTVALAPSPDPSADTTEKPAVENKADAPAAPAVKAEEKPPEKPEDQFETEEQKELKAKYGRPADKGDEWQIRAFRDGQKIRTKLGPVAERIDKMGSPDRVNRGLDLVADLSDPLVPINQAVQKMEALSPSRASDVRNHYYNEILTNYPDNVLSDVLGDQVTLDEVVAAVNAHRNGSKPAETTPAPKAAFDLSGIDFDEMETDYPGTPALIKSMAEALGELRAKAAPAEKPEDDQVKTLSQQVQTFKEKEQQAAVQKTVDSITARGDKMYADAYTVVDAGLRDFGLAPDKDDDDATAKEKSDLAQIIRDRVEPAFDADPESCKLAERIIDLLAKNDPSADDYMDELKTRVDLAFQQVAAPLAKLYQEKRERQSTPATAGTYKRPEVAGSTGAPSGKVNGKPAWLANRPAGMSASEALQKQLANM